MKHLARCYADDGELECVCGLTQHLERLDDYNPDDYLPMGGDPYWAEDQDQ
jgi:hypothetical protein